jgi:hypothetical protein
MELATRTTNTRVLVCRLQHWDGTILLLGVTDGIGHTGGFELLTKKSGYMSTWSSFPTLEECDAEFIRSVKRYTRMGYVLEGQVEVSTFPLDKSTPPTVWAEEVFAQASKRASWQT